MSLQRCISCLLFILVLAGCGTVASTSTPMISPQATPIPCDCGAKADRVSPTDASTTIVEGLLVYEKYGCGSCHTLHAANAGAVIAPPFDGIGRRADERIANPGYTGHATSAAVYIRESITDPDMYYVTGFEIGQIRMPRYPTMTGAELEALVQMLLHQ